MLGVGFPVHTMGGGAIHPQHCKFTKSSDIQIIILVSTGQQPCIEKYSAVQFFMLLCFFEDL